MFLYKSKMMLDFYGGELQMLILFLGYYTMRFLAVLRPFRRYKLFPSTEGNLALRYWRYIRRNNLKETEYK
jgi:hypothetical protein